MISGHDEVSGRVEPQLSKAVPSSSMAHPRLRTLLVSVRPAKPFTSDHEVAGGKQISVTCGRRRWSTRQAQLQAPARRFRAR